MIVWPLNWARPGQLTFAISTWTSFKNFEILLNMPGRFFIVQNLIKRKKAGLEGVEPPTAGFGVRCTSQLCYRPTRFLSSFFMLSSLITPRTIFLVLTLLPRAINLRSLVAIQRKRPIYCSAKWQSSRWRESVLRQLGTTCRPQPPQPTEREDNRTRRSGSRDFVMVADAFTNFCGGVSKGPGSNYPSSSGQDTPSLIL